MRRIYITAVPLEENFVLTKSENNPANFSFRTTSTASAYPIIPIIADSMQPNDEIVVVAVRQTLGAQNCNYDLLLEELATLGIAERQVRDVTVAHTQTEDILLSLFSDLIAQGQADSCYYACSTFGKKTYPMVLFSALQYITKILPNTQLKGIYYREVRREAGRAVATQLYDITTLFSLNQIVDLVAQMDTDNKAQAIQMLLS